MRLAIFDIDGTIFRSSLVIQLCDALVMAGIFPKTSSAEIEKEYIDWLDRKGSYEAYINKVVKIYIKHIKGKRYSKVKRVADGVIQIQKNRVYRFTRDLIKNFKKQGYYLVAVSGSPDYIVESYAKAIGFNSCYGTRLEVIKDKFTGKILNLDSAFKKAEIIKILAKSNKNFDLKQSVAVGDTEGDVAMLSLVGRPIAFNPNLHLAKIAKKKGWQVVVERKDTIYKISNFEFLISNK